MTSLCVSPDGKLLLSAGQVIKMWNLDTKEVYRVSLLLSVASRSLTLIHLYIELHSCVNAKQVALKLGLSELTHSPFIGTTFFVVFFEEYLDSGSM